MGIHSSSFRVAVSQKILNLPQRRTTLETHLLVRGLATSGARFHIQITASAHSGGSDELLYRMIPDLDLLKEQLANDDPEWVTITLRGVGEMLGERITPVPNDDGNVNPVLTGLTLARQLTEELAA